MLIPKLTFWEFKIHNGVMAALDFHRRLAGTLLLKVKVEASLDKYLNLVFTASESMEIYRGTQTGPEKIILNLQLSPVVKREPQLDAAGRSICCCCCFLRSTLSGPGHVSAWPGRPPSPHAEPACPPNSPLTVSCRILVPWRQGLAT